MSEINDIKLLTKLQKLITIYQRVNQLSWTSDQTRKRYPTPELMTTEEMKALIKSYFSLGSMLEEINNEWIKFKNEK